jgi:glycine dehydrogenase subunit 1
MTVTGVEGLRQAALISAKNAHLLAKKLEAKGFEILSRNFLNEFVVKVINADAFLANLQENNILGGIKIDKNRVLVCVTEMNSLEDIEKYEYFAV